MAVVTIVPAILTEDLEELKAGVAKYAAFAKRLQIDVSDGTLAPAKTVPVASVAVAPGVMVDLHMITDKPSAHLEAIVKMKPNMVIFHAEATEDLVPVFAVLKQAGIKAGVAFLKPTYPGAHMNYLEAADHAMIFAGELGVQGSVPDLLQVEKAKIIKKLKPGVAIGWDGGATLTNVRTIFQGGISIINVGSALVKAPDAAILYNDLVAEAEKQGVM